MVYCGAKESFFNKFSDNLTLAVSSKDTAELEEVIKVSNKKCNCDTSSTRGSMMYVCMMFCMQNTTVRVNKLMFYHRKTRRYVS